MTILMKGLIQELNFDSEYFNRN